MKVIVAVIIFIGLMWMALPPVIKEIQSYKERRDVQAYQLESMMDGIDVPAGKSKEEMAK
jgi:hypothetical protein